MELLIKRGSSNSGKTGGMCARKKLDAQEESPPPQAVTK